MTTPKHLWTGDWEQESADAAAARGNGRLPADAADPPRTPETAVPPPRSPRPATRRQRRRRRPLPRPRPRIALLSLLALLLVVGAAYGVTALERSHSSAATGTPWLGAKLEAWPDGGALVTSIAPGSPAASSGLQPGDVIREIQGRPVGAPIDVTEAIDALGVGDALEIQFERNSRTYATSAVLKGRPASAP